jgi:hypothetical protein
VEKQQGNQGLAARGAIFAKRQQLAIRPSKTTRPILPEILAWSTAMPNPTAWVILAEQRKCLIQRMLGAEFSEPGLEAFQFRVDPLREFCASCFIQWVMFRRVPGSDLMGTERKHFLMISRRRRLRHGLVLSSHEGLVSRA